MFVNAPAGFGKERRGDVVAKSARDVPGNANDRIRSPGSWRTPGRYATAVMVEVSDERTAARAAPGRAGSSPAGG